MNKNAKAKKIIRLRNKQAKLTRLLHHYTGELVALDAELCEALTDCIGDAGLDPDTVTAARAPKRPPAGD